ncbi:MAG: hypothetical protein JNK57_02325 [Planctomycetaceae bacterium]|nr:hypothetical protein [Planctomycetaceae bacterium]
MELDCPGCGVVLRLKDEYLGRQVKCPKCGTSLLVAEPEPLRSPYEDDPLFTITPGLTPPPVHQSLRSLAEQPPLPSYVASSAAPPPPVANPNYPAFAPPAPIYSTHGSYSSGPGNPATGYGNRGQIQPGYANPDHEGTRGMGPASGKMGVGAPARGASALSGVQQPPLGDSPYLQTPDAATKSWSMSPGMIALGLLMMLGATVWFVVGLAADRIFFYPPVLFILGIGTVIKGCLGKVE